MATYDDIARDTALRNALQDDLKLNLVDIAFPKADFESDWILLSKGLTVTISHNLNSIPRLCTLHLDSTANFTINTIFDNGSDNTATMSVQSLQSNSCKVTNQSNGITYKYFYLRLWK